MSDAWYRTFFDEVYLKYWKFPPERTREEMAFVLKVLALPPGGRILDLCCGQGRHSLELARRGYRVVGLDLSETLLRDARKAAEEDGLRVEFVRSDMRDIPFKGRFDAAVNLFTSFGYLEDDEEDERVLRAVAGVLKVGGRFLMDIMNREQTIRNFHSKYFGEWPDGTLQLHDCTFDVLSGRLRTRWIWIGRDGMREERTSVLRLYSFTELKKMLDSAGLRTVQVFGGFDGSEYNMDSERMIVLAEKL